MNGQPLTSGAHLDTATIAAYVEGKVSKAVRADVEEHIDECEDCYQIVCELAQHVVPEIAELERRTRTRWITGLGALAMAAAVFLAVRVMTPANDRSANPVAASRMLLVNAGTLGWPLDARLSGFPYLAPTPTTRASASPNKNWDLLAAAEEVQQRYASGTAPEAHHATAVALIVTGRADEAVKQLEAVAEREPTADVLNDLGVALLARGRQQTTDDDFRQALKYLERGRTLDRTRPEIVFNLGLVLEALGDKTRAVSVWEDYLSLDTASPYAATARAHLAQLRTLSP